MQGASPLASPRPEPARHLLSLPRGSGPSQTPKFLSPGPPLSLAAGTAHRESLPIGFAANHGFSPGDARGEAPCMKKPWSPPAPPGKGVGGIGGRKVNQRQGWQARRKASPPAGAGTAGAAGGKEGKPPAGHHSGKVSWQPTGTSPRRARGSPLAAGTRGAPSTKPRRNNLLFW